jgi:hypothetical protein
MSYKYTLQPYQTPKSRYQCPSCKKQGVFSRYINTESGECLSDEVGRCNREIKCGYHYTPAQYFKDHKHFPFAPQRQRNYAPKATPDLRKTPSYIPEKLYRLSLNNAGDNYFMSYLLRLVGEDLAQDALERYRVGTSNHWRGATVFWQVDMNERIRTGKIILFDALTGKRVQEPYKHVSWAHTKLPGFQLQQCFFGEHLLQEHTGQPIAIVESEKTAIVASVYCPEFIWLACGGVTMLSQEKCKVLTSRKVILFPDLGAFENWSTKAMKLSHLASIEVSSLLEKNAIPDELEKGLDLADYLERFKIEEIRPKQKEKQSAIRITTEDISLGMSQTNAGKEFNHLIIAGVQLQSGEVFDVIYTSNGELVHPGDQANTVNRLAVFFHKQLQQGLLNGRPCWLHQDPRFQPLLVNNNQKQAYGF